MKKILTYFLFISCCLQLHLASAQSAEFTQLTLNIEKLSQFKQILSDMKKGYNLVSQGYGTIKSIAEGNFSLHRLFLDGLMAVKPELRNYKKVAAIIAHQAKILSEYKSAFNQVKNGGRFRQEELQYLADVYGNLFDQSLQNLDDLATILTSNKMRMSDDERIAAIDRLYMNMEDKLFFLRNFNQKARALDRVRLIAHQEAKTLKGVYGY